jgi:hypothetical protein
MEANSNGHQQQQLWKEGKKLDGDGCASLRSQVQHVKVGREVVPNVFTHDVVQVGLIQKHPAISENEKANRFLSVFVFVFVFVFSFRFMFLLSIIHFIVNLEWGQVVRAIQIRSSAGTASTHLDVYPLRHEHLWMDMCTMQKFLFHFIVQFISK